MSYYMLLVFFVYYLVFTWFTIMNITNFSYHAPRIINIFFCMLSVSIYIHRGKLKHSCQENNNEIMYEYLMEQLYHLWISMLSLLQL